MTKVQGFREFTRLVNKQKTNIENVVRKKNEGKVMIMCLCTCVCKHVCV